MRRGVGISECVRVQRKQKINVNLKRMRSWQKNRIEFREQWDENWKLMKGFGHEKNRQMEREQKRRGTTERREIWLVVIAVADPSLVLPSCNSDASVPLLLWLSLWGTVGCLYLVPITDCSALAWCWDSRLWGPGPPWIPIYPSNTHIHSPST